MIPFVFLLPFFLLFLCWGSFLNVVGFRIINSKKSLWTRSSCPLCEHSLAWYDLIPVVSYFLLAGRCRYCNGTISPLYPIIELATALFLTILLLLVPLPYFLQYLLFFSFLIVTVRSDLESMLISSFMTLYVIPIPFIFSGLSMLPISLSESIIGAISGYIFLFSIGTLFFWWTGKQGIGEGDFELLALIGAWTGPLGCWIAVTIGSMVGVLIGFALQTKRDGNTESLKIPFGPCLAFGAFCAVILAHQSWWSLLAF
jgi:leader peptidase (prepilin peptidase)/N-methyltransferase